MRKPEMLSEHSKQAEDMVVQGSPCSQIMGGGYDGGGGGVPAELLPCDSCLDLIWSSGWNDIC